MKDLISVLSSVALFLAFIKGMVEAKGQAGTELTPGLLVWGAVMIFCVFVLLWSLPIPADGETGENNNYPSISWGGGW